MKKTIVLAGLSCLPIALGQAAAAEISGFRWGATIEVGVDSVVRADDAAAELTDTYLSADAAFELDLSDRVMLFGALTVESVTDASETRNFEDMGAYVSEFGLRFDLGRDAFMSVGKISPVYGVAWDAAPGFYGTSLAEDYELSEMVGATVDAPLAGGTLSAAVFYADDTFLSDSIGDRRGRNSAAAGGVGNTGKVNNAAIQWQKEYGNTVTWIGARHLKAGAGDLSDENGIVAGASHDFGGGIDGLFEVAHFNGAGGANTDATYATLGGSYATGPWTVSATYTGVDQEAGTYDNMIALGADYAFANDMELNLGVAQFDVGGEDSTALGIALIIPFGG